MNDKTIQGPYILTVIIRDDGPMVNCGDSPSYRSVQFLLTKEQRDIIRLKQTYSSGGIEYYENVSRCFLESPNEVKP